MRGSSRRATSQERSSRAAVQESPLAKQGHLMPLPHEFFGEIGNYPLRPTIEARRAAFGEGGDLCDLHRRFSIREFAEDRRSH